MTINEIVEHILSKFPEISKDEILEKLDEEKKKTDGLLSDEVLLRKIAAELGIEVQKEIATPALSIQDLIPGLNDVSIVGRVVAVFPTRTFGKQGGGKVASLLVIDNDNLLRVILWNDRTDYIESGQVKTGKIVRVAHGYTKEGYKGEVELHLGEKGEIRTDPKDVEPMDYPTINKFVTEISEITSEHVNERVNLTGTVKERFSISTFERKDKSCGKVMRFKLADETGETSVVVWNRKVDEFEETIKRGVNLQVINAKVKDALREGFEVHVDSVTYVESVGSLKERMNIENLKVELNDVKVRGKVVTKPIVRKVKTSEGKFVKLTVFELEDETGRIWVSAWREHARNAGNLEVGQKVTIEDAYVKKGFGDQLELSTKKATSITKHTRRTKAISKAS